MDKCQENGAFRLAINYDCWPSIRLTLVVVNQFGSQMFEGFLSPQLPRLYLHERVETGFDPINC
jgi:hypothetical protein